ncbi:ferritin-like domain-containing protein [Paenisporosarcina sp. TG20]|uniref:ferritin-like domain-containing protein n=1 Tax=Paenisporosarcina sp. TG20 TaxID=1211706 RepID=UPI0002E50A49|nr:ferritin-like domain-containing protein [Paenisporosarcina sp. TG20]
MFNEHLKKAIEEEYRAYYFYKYMLRLTDDPYWQSFILHAMEDEKSHYEMFQQLYYMLTGQFVQNPSKPEPPIDLKQAAKDSLMEELEATEFYKEMLLTIPIPQAYNPLFIAMQDEIEHAIRFSTMYNAL